MKPIILYIKNLHWERKDNCSTKKGKEIWEENVGDE
jgi:hypothetical protein